MQRPLTFLGEHRPAFLAHLAARLDDLICAETAAIARDRGIAAPVHSFSTLLFLARVGPATLSEMALVDGQSHQLLAFRLNPLVGLGLVERTADPDDRRRKPYRLTRRGRTEVARLEEMVTRLARAMRGLSEEIGVDLATAIDVALERLTRIPLRDRFELADATAAHA